MKFKIKEWIDSKENTLEYIRGFGSDVEIMMYRDRLRVMDAKSLDWINIARCEFKGIDEPKIVKRELIEAMINESTLPWM